MSEPPVTVFINNSALEMLFSCQRKYQVTCLWGYKQDGNKYTEVGRIFHEFAAELARRPDMDVRELLESLCKASDDKQLVAAVLAYHNTKPLNGEILKFADGSLAIEKYFDVPIEETFAGGYQFRICGTIDRIDYDEYGLIRVVDHKTAWNPARNDVLDNYATHFQIPMYLYSCYNYLSQFMLPEDRDKVSKDAIYGKYHGVFLTSNPPKFQLSEKIVMTKSLHSWVETLLAQAINDIVSNILPLGNKELAAPTGMLNNSCKTCWLQKYCHGTRDDEKIIELLSCLKPEPYDPRTWR